MNKIVDIISKWSGKAELANLIQSDLYGKYNIKDGLRFSDVSKEVAGLTRIGEIFCYSLVDGELIPESGRFRYRGVEVKEIVNGYQGDKKFGYEEVCFLLIFGELPTTDELDDFIHLLEEYRQLPFEVIRDITNSGPNTDIMNTMIRAILALYSYDPNAEDTSLENALKQCLMLVAKMPLIAIYSYQAYLSKTNSKKVVISTPVKGLSLSENLLYMLKGQDHYSSFEVEVLDLALLLLAEHGAGSNASFTTHVVSSSGTDTYSVFSAAFAAMKGPKHGGVILKVSEMMDVLEKAISQWQDRDQIEKALTTLINEDVFGEAGSLYGFGQALYVKSDPRVAILKEYIKQLAYEKGFADEYNLYVRIAQSATDQLTSKTNEKETVVVTIEYYMSLVFKMLGIPKELFTPMFTISRSTGIASHRLEELMNNRGIIRPIFKSVNASKPYTKIEERSSEANNQKKS